MELTSATKEARHPEKVPNPKPHFLREGRGRAGALSQQPRQGDPSVALWCLQAAPPSQGDSETPGPPLEVTIRPLQMALFVYILGRAGEGVWSLAHPSAPSFWSGEPFGQRKPPGN